MGSEKGQEYYENLFRKNLNYHESYKNSWYYVHWTQIIKILKNVGFTPKVLEVGCGTGQLAQYIHDEGFDYLKGFDFSEYAIEIANGKSGLIFKTENALNPSAYIGEYNTIICTEVLEHIVEDLSVIDNFPLKCFVIFSVPNFDEPSHIRWFTSERQIKKRYYKKIDIKEITRIGNIYIVSGRRENFDPNILQRLLASREEIKISSFLSRIRHRIKNILKLKNV